MEYTTLGGGLRVSRLALGCEPLGGMDWGPIDVTAAERAVSAAADAGINFFDTADVYGLGVSEERLSRALGSRRHDAVIASKVGVRWEDAGPGQRARTYRDASPVYLARAVEASLRRLALESLPLLYLHWPDPATSLTETMGALVRLKEAGKVQHIGLSNFTGELIRAAHAIAPVAAVQAEYNLLNLQAAADVLPTCRALGVPMVAYGPLAQGLLTGKFRAGAEFSADDRRHRLAHFRGADFARGLEAADQLRALGRACDQTPAQMALRWVLNSPGVACAVAGARTEEQVRQNAAACDALASGLKR